jgi:DNA polymerase-3 subunit beta
MHVTVEQETLVQALENTLGVIDKKGTMPILAHCLVEANGNGLRVSATDLEISFRGTFTAEVQEPGTFTVRVVNLHSLAKDLPKGPLSITGDEREIRVETGEAKYKFLVLPPDQFPEVPCLPEEWLIEVEAKTLVQMMDKVVFSIGGSDISYHLQAAQWEAVRQDNEACLRMVTTDGHRLSLAERPIPGLEELQFGGGLLVPGKGMAEIRRFLNSVKNGTVLMGIGGSHTTDGPPRFIGFKAGSKELTVRLLDRRFPEYQRLLPEKWEHHFIFNRRELAEAIKRVSLLTQERFRGVVFTLDGRMAELKHDNPEVGHGREVVELKQVQDISSHPEQPIIIGFNARYILEPLAAMDSEEAVLRLNSPEKPVLWEGSNDARTFWLVMPMSL